MCVGIRGLSADSVTFVGDLFPLGVVQHGRIGLLIVPDVALPVPEGQSAILAVNFVCE